jgi:hypothetical protein
MKIMMKIDVNFGPGFRQGKKVTYFNSREATNISQEPEKASSLNTFPIPPFEAPDPSQTWGSASSTTSSSALSAENAGMNGLMVVGDIHGSLNSLKNALEVGLWAGFCVSLVWV